MTKEQAMRYARLVESLGGLGIDGAGVDALLRAERTLLHWSERECGDGSDWAIERDEDGEGEGVPYNVYHGPGESRRYRIADREAGAIRRIDAIIGEAKRRSRKLSGWYRQGDPRGCQVYVLRRGDVPAGEPAGSCYTRGIAVCL